MPASRTQGRRGRKSPPPCRPGTRPSPESRGAVCGVATLGPGAVSAPASLGSGRKAGALGQLPPSPTPARGAQSPQLVARPLGRAGPQVERPQAPAAFLGADTWAVGGTLAPGGNPRARASGLGPKHAPCPRHSASCLSAGSPMSQGWVLGPWACTPDRGQGQPVASPQPSAHTWPSAQKARWSLSAEGGTLTQDCTARTPAWTRAASCSFLFQPEVCVCVCDLSLFFLAGGRCFFEIEVFTFGGVRLSLKQDNNSGVTGTLEPRTPLFTGR